MLPRSQLVPLKSELLSIKAEGKTWASPLFGLLVRRREGAEARVGFIVSKRIDKRSVVRHQVKRKLAVGVAKVIGEIGGNDLVFLAKRPLGEASQEEVDREIRRILVKGGLV
jgi:ribonuclease P protein component